MFTGIVDHCGKIVSIVMCPIAGAKLQIESQFVNLQLGESIAVDGICLTVKRIEGKIFECDLSNETLAMTTASSFKASRSVNLERALLPSTRIGGHFVTGHVNKTLIITHYQKQGDFLEIAVSGCSENELKLCTPKGSIALNGVSLTINTVKAQAINCVLIPETLARTNLSALALHEKVNVEFDLLAQMVARQLAHFID